VTRSLRADVRNPLLSLPAAREIQALPEDSRKALRQLLSEIAVDAALRAEQSWKKSKGPMAAYWKAVSVYAKHARRLAA
jgi:hypothetical protein